MVKQIKKIVFIIKPLVTLLTFSITFLFIWWNVLKQAGLQLWKTMIG